MSFTVGLRCPHSVDAEGKETCTCKSFQGKLSTWTAAEYGLVEEIKKSLDADASKANVCDTYGYTPLHYAAQRDHDSVVAFLLKKGAQVDSKACGATPLHRAAASNALSSCRMLVAAGADVNARDESFGDKRTPLMKAASQGHWQIVELLVSTKATNQTLKDAQGLSAWDLAAAFPYVMRLLDRPPDAAIISKPNGDPESNQVDNSNVPPKDVLNISSSQSSLITCEWCHSPALFMKNIAGHLICRNCLMKSEKRSQHSQ